MNSGFNAVEEKLPNKKNRTGGHSQEKLRNKKLGR